MKPLKEKLKKQKKIKILILRLKPIGDTVLISPVFRNIKKTYPQAKISVIIYPMAYDVIKNNPNVDKVIILKRNNFSKLIYYLKSIFKYYHVIIDYINNPTSTIIAFFTHAKVKIGNRTKRNFFYNYRFKFDKKEYSSIRCLRLLEPIGISRFDDYLPELFLDRQDIITVNRLFSSLKIKKRVTALFVSAKYATRQYPPENFAYLGKLIIEKAKHNILFLFGKDDIQSLYTIQKIIQENKKVFFISPKITIGELCAVLSKVRFLITNDTGPKHLATALKIPTLTIFSATDEEVWNPPTSWAPTIRKKIDCAPCNKLSCPKGTIECMSDLKPEEVFKAYLKAIKNIK